MNVTGTLVILPSEEEEEEREEINNDVKVSEAELNQG